jgi:hypothetical protein
MGPLELTGVAAMLGIVKEIVALARDGKNSEVMRRLLDLQGAMLDLQIQSGQLVDEVRRLKAELDDKTAMLNLEADMEFEEDGLFYVRKSERDRNKTVRYCPICWGKEHKLVPLASMGSPGYFKCVDHQSFYTTSEYYQWKESKKAASARPAGWMDGYLR